MSQNKKDNPHLQNSALAQLLLENKPLKGREISGELSGPMDLSRKGPVMSNPPRLDPIGSRPEFVTQSKERSFGQRMSEAGGSRKTKIKPDMFKGNVDMTPCKDAVEIVKDLLLGISREMEILSRLPPNRMFDSESKWRCLICPFSGAAPRILYSHYQFHQQLLTSGSSSQSHMEWLAAYQRTRGQPCQIEPQRELSGGEEPSGLNQTGETYQSLRKLLSRSPDDRHPPTAGFLKAMVQNIIPPELEEGPMAWLASQSAEQVQQRPGQSTSTASPGSQDTQSGVQPGNDILHFPIKVEPNTDQCISEFDIRNTPVHHGRDYAIAEAIGQAPKTAIREQRSPVASPVSVVAAAPSRQNVSPLFASVSSMNPGNALSQNPTKAALLAVRVSPDAGLAHHSNSAPPFSDDLEQPNEDQSLASRQHQPRSLLGKRPHPGDDSCGMCSPSSRAVSAASPHVTSVSLGSCRPQTDSPDSAKKHFTDAGVQCELLTDNCSSPDAPFAESDPSVELLRRSYQPVTEQLQEDNCASSSSNPTQRCCHCGIQFDDDVLYSIHMGCHSHRDPFICNVCGKHCGNRYGFYTHIMRGHHR